MKNKVAKIISCFLSFALLATTLQVGAFANLQETKANADDLYPHLTEVPEGYIGIYTPEDLNKIRNNLDKNYILMNDISFSDEDFQENGEYYNDKQGWIPIGSESSPFTGIFNGNSYSIDKV